MLSRLVQVKNNSLGARLLSVKKYVVSASFRGRVEMSRHFLPLLTDDWLV